MKLVSLPFLLAFIFLASGLKCWRCENARTIRECKVTGRWQQCQSNQGSCQTEVRRDPQGLRIMKRCKQTLACVNDMQNSKCHRPKLNSVCRCCCGKDACNMKGLHCKAKKSAKNHPPRRQRPKKCRSILTPEFGSKTCSKVPENKIGSLCKFSCIEGYRLVGRRASKCINDKRTKIARFNREAPVCKPSYCRNPGKILHGSMTCTHGNRIKSSCRFTCDEELGYELFPAGFKSSICQENLHWSSPFPCCVRACPKYAAVDLVLMMDSSSSIGETNWDIMKEFVQNVTNKFTIAPDAAHISVLRYNNHVDSDTQILFNASVDRPSFDEAYSKIPYDGVGTRTGEALRYVKDDVLLDTSGNRDDVTDVLLVITDGISQDLVGNPAEELRDRNVVTFALGIDSVHGTLNRSQLLEIAGKEENLLVAEGGFTDLDATFANKLSEKVCDYQCQNNFRDEM